MSRKVGRIRCGRCERVLYDPARRQPRPHEVQELDRLTGYELGRRRAQVSPARDRRGVRTGDDQGRAVLTCPGCHVTYRERLVGEFGARAESARARGEDLLLGRADTGRPLRPGEHPVAEYGPPDGDTAGPA